MYKFFIWNTHPTYQEKIDIFINQSKDNDKISITQIPADVGIGGIINYIQDKEVDCIIHRNEHGILHVTKEWATLTEYCLDKGIMVMSFDFGYFGHYDNFMVDFYQRDCVSSIYKQWNKVPTTLDWSTAPEQIQKYRSHLLKQVEECRSSELPDGLHKKDIVTIWCQWTTDLIKLCFYENNKPIKMDKWVMKLIDIIKAEGMTPVVKMSPVKVINPFREIQTMCPVFVGRKNHVEELEHTLYSKHINSKLIAHSKYHVINCSSVSNELALCGAKTIAMGRSWFDGLGVFYEPRTWESVLQYQDPDPNNMNKWFNWWLSRQVPMDQICNKMIEIYETGSKLVS